MKKIIAAILALSFAVGMCTGCGSEDIVEIDASISLSEQDEKELRETLSQCAEGLAKATDKYLVNKLEKGVLLIYASGTYSISVSEAQDMKDKDLDQYVTANDSGTCELSDDETKAILSIMITEQAIDNIPNGVFDVEVKANGTVKSVSVSNTPSKKYTESFEFYQKEF